MLICQLQILDRLLDAVLGIFVTHETPKPLSPASYSILLLNMSSKNMIQMIYRTHNKLNYSRTSKIFNYSWPSFSLEVNTQKHKSFSTFHPRDGYRNISSHRRVSLTCRHNTGKVFRTAATILYSVDKDVEEWSSTSSATQPASAEHVMGRHPEDSNVLKACRTAPKTLYLETHPNKR